MRLTVIADNLARQDDLVTQHGLCFWIEYAGRHILFDTGSDASWLDNAQRLGIDPLTAEIVYLSHGHWDHGGGVPALLEYGWRGRFVVHAEAWRRKRAIKPGEDERNTGLSWSRESLEQLGIQVEMVTGPQELFDGVWTTGSIPGDHPIPTAPGLQVYAEGDWRPEDFCDEQTLVLETPRGLVVITGCCHRGVLNTLETVQKVTGREDVYALFGGLHQKDEPRERCLELAEALRKAGLKKVWANHCTGQYPFAQMKEVLGDDLVWADAGTVVSLL